MSAALDSLYLLREAGALVSAGIAAGSVWPGGAGAANPPATPNLPWSFVSRNAPPTMQRVPLMSQSAPGRLTAAGWISDAEAGDATSDAMWQAQRDADWASLHAGPPGTVVPPMPADFEPSPPGAQPPPFSAAYYAQLNAQNAPAPPGTTVASVPSSGTYYNPPPAPSVRVPPRSIVPMTIVTPPAAPTLPPPAVAKPPSLGPAPTAPPPTVDTATPIPTTTGTAGTGAPATSMTPYVLAGGAVLALIYFGRKKKRGR